MFKEKGYSVPDKRTVANISREVPDLEEKVLAAISKYNMLEKGDKVLISVSGGPDSIALLHLLFSIHTLLNLQLHVFHLDHMVRGDSSREDAIFVKKLASALGIPVNSLSYDIPAYIKDKNLSLQEGAREIRYRLLDEVCDEVGADKIATGHNANDQVETFLMRMIRGTGASGLKGIPPVRGRIIRPLIEVSRNEIEDYLKYNQFDCRLDESNLKMDYLRNRVRQRLIPFCLEENEKFCLNILNTIELISDDDAFLEQMAEDSFGELVGDKGDNVIVIKYAALSKLPIAIQRRVVRRALQLIKGNLKEIEFKHVDLLLGEMGHEGSGPIDLPGGIVVLNEYGNLTITLREELDPKYRCQSLKVELTIPGVTNVPDLGINIIARLEDADKVDVGSNNKKEKAYLDFEKIALPLWVRTRSPGDRFVPLGMSHRKKIQDFFVDNKIPKRKRDRIPIIESQGQIVWIGKIAIDDRVKVTGSTEKVLVLEVK